MGETYVNLLIVDDSSFSRNKVRKSVREIDEDIQVYEAADGLEALQILRENKIDIMILDIIMPEMNGIQLLEAMRHDLNFRSTIVLVFTSLTERSTLLECYQLGAFDFIQKPLDELEFKARLKAVNRNKMLERKSMQYLDTLRKQNEELKVLNQVLGETKVKMLHQEKLAGIGQLAAGVAHEINNPLGYLMSNLEILNTYLGKFRMLFEAYEDLEQEVLTQEKRDTFEAIKRIQELKANESYDYMNEDIGEIINDGVEGLERIKHIVDGLRNFSRVDAVRHFEAYSINKGIEDTLALMKNELKYTSDIRFLKGEIPDIEAIGGEINQVLLNLLINANDAIKEKFEGIRMGEIEIKTIPAESAIQISIRDNGNGIPQHKLSQIFNPFFTTKPVGAGTGLGLSIAYDVIETKHKGSIDVTSQEGIGTTFLLTLPITQKQKPCSSDGSDS